MRFVYLFPGEDKHYHSTHAGDYKPQRGKWFRRLKIALIVLGVLMLVYPFTEPFMLQVDQTAITCSDLPTTIGQLRIVYVSDIHHGSQPFSETRLNNLIKRINAANADLVLLGGDYATDKLTSVAFFNDLPRISSRYGVYAVAGECDRYPMDKKNESVSRLRNAMSSAGITLLSNEVVSIRIGTSDIYLAGIDEVTTQQYNIPSLAQQVSKDDFVIFLSHNPSIISEALAATDRNGHGNWIDLALFGHTHGGQLPFLERVFDFDGIPYRYESGWLHESRAWLLISRGFGTTGLPARLFCQPQMHIITIQTGN